MLKEVAQGLSIGLILIVGVVSIGSYVACNLSGNHGGEDGHMASDASSDERPAPEHIPNPPSAEEMRSVEITPTKVAKGEELFAQCSACHGEAGEGKPGLGPTLASESFLAAASDHFLIETISKGRSGTPMAAYGNMMEPDEIESVVAYLRAQTQTEPVELDHGESEGDQENGAKVYADICAGCHGATGAGYTEIRNGTGIGRKDFLQTATNGLLRHIIRHGKSGTQMRPFAAKSPVAVANLSDGEIDDVITYLRHNAR